VGDLAPEPDRLGADEAGQAPAHRRRCALRPAGELGDRRPAVARQRRDESAILGAERLGGGGGRAPGRPLAEVGARQPVEPAGLGDLIGVEVVQTPGRAVADHLGDHMGVDSRHVATAPEVVEDETGEAAEIGRDDGREQQPRVGRLVEPDDPRIGRERPREGPPVRRGAPDLDDGRRLRAGGPHRLHAHPGEPLTREPLPSRRARGRADADDGPHVDPRQPRRDLQDVTDRPIHVIHGRLPP